MAALGAFVAVGVKLDDAKNALFGRGHVCAAGLEAATLAARALPDYS